jgi:hypothetical protein
MTWTKLSGPSSGLTLAGLSVQRERNGNDGPLRDAITDEEFAPHPFNSRTPYEPGDDRDIWCKDCEYHRDHAIHIATGQATSSGANRRRFASTPRTR